MRKIRTSSLRATLLTVSTSLLLIGCSGQSESSLLSAARIAIDKHDAKTAIIQLKSALQKNAQSGEARFLLGRALLQAGDAKSAVLELEKARELKHSDDEVLPSLAQALLESGQAKRVTDQFANTGLNKPGASAELKVAVAKAYAAQGMLNQSEATTAAALQSDPKNAAARLLEVRFAANKAAIEPALALLDKLLADEPKLLEAWHFKGELLRVAKRDAAGASDAYTKALAIDARYLPAHTSLLAMAAQRADMKGFRDRLADLKNALPNHPETNLFTAQAALMDGDLKAARESAQQLLRIAPNNVRVLQLAGSIEASAGALPLAETYLTKAIQQAPTSPASRQLLAATYLRSGQAPKALTTLQPLLERQFSGATVLAMAAEAYLQTGDLAKAEDYFGRAAKANPADPKARTALALTQIGRGQADAGFAQLEALATSDPGTYADLALISARLRRNDLDNALRSVDGLQAKMPDKPLPHQLRGNILLRRNDRAAARASYDKALAADSAYFPAVKALASLDLADNKLDEARHRFEAVLQREPKNVGALLALVELKLRGGGKVPEAVAMLTEAIKQVPGDAGPRLALIDLHLSQRNATAARAIAQEAAAAFPGDVPVLDALGRAQMAAGDLQQAVSTFGKIVALQPTSPEPHLRIAQALMQGKDYPAARLSLRRALDVSPNLLVAERALIEVALAARKVDDALEVARQVQRQRPKEPIGRVLEADILWSQRRWDPAIQALNAALTIERSTGLATKLHALYRAAGRPADAQRFATTWTREYPKDVDFLNAVGTSAAAVKDYPAAEASYRAVLSLRPTDPLALNNVAWILAKQGKDGVEFAGRANQLAPNQPSLMDTMAIALAATDQWPKAVEWARKAVAGAPNAPQYRLSLAKLLIKAGDKTAARAELDTLAKLGDKFGGQTEVAALLATL